MVKEIYNHGYIYFYKKGNIHIFLKQEKIKKYWKNYKKLGIEKYKNIYLREIKKVNKVKKIVFVFACFPDRKYVYHPSLQYRFFGPNFRNIITDTGENTLVVVIYDVAYQLGTFYTNTKVYPTIEKNIKNLINSYIKKYNVEKEDILLFGGSRAGTAAVNIAVPNDYNFFITDPIHYLKGSTDGDRSEFYDGHFIDNHVMKVKDTNNYKGQGYMILGEKVKPNFELSMGIFNNRNIDIYNSKESTHHHLIYRQNLSRIKEEIAKRGF